jgi:hypothetical protein
LEDQLGTVVTKISNTAPSHADNQTDAVHIKTAVGKTFSSDTLLLTAPLGCLKAGAFRFTPPLPDWKQDIIQRLGYGNLNKVIMQFPKCFWDETVDYFGAAPEEGYEWGNCFMFWNLQVGHASQIQQRCRCNAVVHCRVRQPPLDAVRNREPQRLPCLIAALIVCCCVSNQPLLQSLHTQIHKRQGLGQQMISASCARLVLFKKPT